MTQAQHKARLRRIIKAWRSRLAINHVKLEIAWDEEPDDPDAMASIHCSDYYDEATLRFRNDLIDADSFLLNRVVVHELMHFVMRDYGNAVRSIESAGVLSTDLRLLWHDRCHDAEEAVIDRLAHRFVELGGVVE